MLTKIAYQSWENCYRLTNGRLELIITGDVGPRVIHFGLVDGVNVFKQFADQIGKTGGDQWRNYGGHRLWHAPEELNRTNLPDNQPIKVEASGEAGCRIIQPAEAQTGIQKEIAISFNGDQQVQVVHRLRNFGKWDVTLAAWALSVMAPGGTAVIPLPPRGQHADGLLLPTSSLALWAYTDLSDPRFTFGQKYILIRQDASATHPIKIGASAPDGWSAYINQGMMFFKQAAFIPDATYPDLGSSIEVFTNTKMLEVETLSPLTTLRRGGEHVLEHAETWSLARDVSTPQNDQDVDTFVLPQIERLRHA